MEVSVAKGEIIKGKPVADAMSESLIKEVNDLKNSIEKLNNDNAKNKDDLNNANKKLETLTKENEDLKKELALED